MTRRGENIYKRKDGRWEGRYIKNRDCNNKAIYGYVYARTYNDVKDKLINAKMHIKHQTLLETPSKTLSELSTIWLENILKTCKQSTYVKYRNSVFKHIIPAIGKYQVFDIDTKLINEFCQNKLKIDRLSPKSVKDILSVIKLIIKFANNLGISSHCDFDSIYIKPDRSTIRGMTTVQMRILTNFLIKNINHVNIGILISLYTGLRIGELCALKFSDISFEERIIHINKTMQRIQNFNGNKNKTDIVISSPKSECSVRDIPIPQFIVTLIFEHSLYAENAYLLTGEKDKFVEPRTLENKFGKITTLCNIKDVTFHMIRHTFATTCIEAGVDVKSLSEILGHSSVNITLNRYVHSSMETKQSNMEKMYRYSAFHRQ